MKNAQLELFHKYGGFFKSHGIQGQCRLHPTLIEHRFALDLCSRWNRMNENAVSTRTNAVDAQRQFSLGNGYSRRSRSVGFRDRLLSSSSKTVHHSSACRAAFRIEIAKLKLKSDLLTLKNSHYKGNIRFVEENPIDESLHDETF